ncbi:MAG TPA: hypothetical protein VN493_17065 [Thermoanaerobaculia bacterium]|nr:hypothetical protein [Thermoanaerobaculia bacterium]
MKKALVCLVLTLALTIPVVYAGRWTQDGGTLPFDARELSQARDFAALGGLEREGGYRTLVVGAAVPGARAAACQAKLYDRRGGLLDEVALNVDPGSTAQFDFADRIGSRSVAAAEVSCDQAFYPYAAAAAPEEPKVTWAEGVGPSGACDFSVKALEIEPGLFLAGQSGTLHIASQQKAKGIVCTAVPKDLKVGRLVMEWDVTTGPWHKKSPHGNHGMAWLHRGRFRSGTVSNVNAFGPGKNILKMNQNVDMAKQKNTNQKVGVALVPNNTYHLRYTYDAANRLITTEIFDSGVLLKKMTMQGTAQNRTLSVPVFGFSTKGALFTEFGHFPGQHFPEMPSFGWRYSNLRLELDTRASAHAK